MRVKLVRPEAKPPARMTPGSAGLDLYSAEDVEVPPCRSQPDGCVDVGRALVPTGIAIEVPAGTVGRIGSRSGLSTKMNIEVGAGWIDSDYRGEVMVEIKNLSSKPFSVKPGERIAQLVIIPVVDVEVRVFSRLEDTSRRDGGFGSTGMQ